MLKGDQPLPGASSKPHLNLKLSPRPILDYVSHSHSKLLCKKVGKIQSVETFWSGKQSSFLN